MRPLIKWHISVAKVRLGKGAPFRTLRVVRQFSLFVLIGYLNCISVRTKNHWWRQTLALLEISPKQVELLSAGWANTSQ